MKEVKNIRTYQEVPKRAKNSINCKIDKLRNKYGTKATRLVVMKYFADLATEEKCLRDIAAKEEELANLKKRGRA